MGPRSISTILSTLLNDLLYVVYVHAKGGVEGDIRTMIGSMQADDLLLYLPNG